MTIAVSGSGKLIIDSGIDDLLMGSGDDVLLNTSWVDELLMGSGDNI